jgi:hypothetical protein
VKNGGFVEFERSDSFRHTNNIADWTRDPPPDDKWR